MIIVRLIGGLGNQMFQYAAGLALAEARRTILKLDVSWFREDESYEPHNRYALSCFNITEQFATEEEVRRLQGFALTRSEALLVRFLSTLRFNEIARPLKHSAQVFVNGNRSYDAAFLRCPDGTYLDGMFQSEQFFQSVAPLLRMHFSFRYPAAGGVDQLASKIRSVPVSVAVHFRRGDYVSDPRFSMGIGALDFDYYSEALKQIGLRFSSAHLFIFSDDIDWVQQNFRPGFPHEFVRAVEPWHPWDKIRLMSLCNHFVIANSTFSWWAAWLNPRSDKIVIAPDPWFQDSTKDSSSIVPEGWLRIARLGTR